ncbi:phosphomevalonate kinase [Apilactobacillus xinyiensis]|uniref:phosphomevalonate kinase n=1 Tax=Apilactobacillus xinyiensis TaxID=2841032 RepID=A0ABT0HZX9_9LACO|nr:phosphomevalonate kinase [Apilactobacillus xinyiensis]MCK8624135.1 phosphomevalonate kinase [Apilactobacillus xinyiensis]MCL0318129.1 phosphomevalonate kinase [Apilactobacillus xinyiensis]
MISVKAPGKLYIAGEYAVVEKGNPSIIVALNQFITVSIEKSNDYGSIVSKQYSENSIYWKRIDNKIIFDNRDNPFHYILAAINIVETYAQSMSKNLKTYHLKVDSELDNSDGKKYGLGSSAAVTVATVKALCQFYDIDVSKDELFKLSAITHLEIQGNGSLGDIAASVYGGWIAYEAFDREWLKQMRPNLSIKELINKKWPYLRIEPLTPPTNLKLLIGWTGSPASTSQLVDKVSSEKSSKENEYQEFVQKSKACLERMIKGFYNKNLETIQREIIINRKLLHQLGQITNVIIETPSLKKLCDIAIENGSAAKSSGAGGGDCGIAIANSDNNEITKILNEWENNNIKQLNLEIHKN